MPLCGIIAESMPAHLAQDKRYPQADRSVHRDHPERTFAEIRNFVLH